MFCSPNSLKVGHGLTQLEINFLVVYGYLPREIVNILIMPERNFHSHSVVPVNILFIDLSIFTDLCKLMVGVRRKKNV